MSSFFQREIRGFLGDTVILTASLYSDDGTQLIPQADISAVKFFVMAPDDEAGVPSVGTYANLTTVQGSNQDLTFTAVEAGAGGNSITVQYVNTGTLAVSLSAQALTVDIEQGVTTASAILAAVNSDPVAPFMVRASLPTTSDGSGFPIAFGPTNLSGGNGAAGTIPSDGTGQYIVPGYINDAAGHYRAYAVFTYSDGSLSGLTKSVPCNYEIEDPFSTTGASPADPYVDQCWLKISDLFDSELGGPWLRDMTLRVFDKYKLRGLIPEVLLAINSQMPYSNYDEAGFPYGQNDGGALFAEGLLVATVRHLMRSYAEQPDIPGSPVAWEDRRRYQDTWKKIYDVEYPVFKEWLVRFKLRDYDITNASLLVASKAGRLMPGPVRSRGFGGGW